jgi:serralysin
MAPGRGRVLDQQHRTGPDRDDRIIYDKDSGVLHYDADSTRSGKAVAFTMISKNLSMTSREIDIV